MTLNGEMALILRYFTEFIIVSVAHCVNLFDKAILCQDTFKKYLEDTI